jgi:hypothetical protein
MSALGHKRTFAVQKGMSALPPNVLQKTPECVAKLFAALRSRNTRIRLNGALIQCCTLAFVLESLLRVLPAKIVLQHNPPESGHR